MESFFRLWRSLPRFFLAALFSLLVAIALAGPDSVAQLLAMFGELPAKYPQVEGINVLLLFALGLVGVLGVLALEAMIAGAELVLARLDRRRALRIRRPLGFRALLLTPIPELAKAYLKTNLSNILAHNRLKSLSTNELIDKEAEVAVHAKRIEDFIGGAVDAEFMEDVNYQGSVTQEQALLDRCKNEIHEIYYLVFVLLMGEWIGIRFWASPIQTVLALSALPIVTAGLLPILSRRRRRLASHIALGYLDTFVVGDLASVDDREAE